MASAACCDCGAVLPIAFLPEAATAVETLLISITIKRMFQNARFMISSHGTSNRLDIILLNFCLKKDSGLLAPPVALLKGDRSHLRCAKQHGVLSDPCQRTKIRLGVRDFDACCDIAQLSALAPTSNAVGCAFSDIDSHSFCIQDGHDDLPLHRGFYSAARYAGLCERSHSSLHYPLYKPKDQT